MGAITETVGKGRRSGLLHAGLGIWVTIDLRRPDLHKSGFTLDF